MIATLVRLGLLTTFSFNKYITYQNLSTFNNWSVLLSCNQLCVREKGVKDPKGGYECLNDAPKTKNVKEEKA